MKYLDILEREYREQKEAIDKGTAIVLYGNSIIACILKVAVRQLEFEKPCVVFDKGNFLECNEFTVTGSEVVITCSSRIATRESMQRDAEKFFSGATVCDFYAIYYKWITDCVKRDCDYEVLAETLCLCKEEKCVNNIDSINTLYCNLRCKECHNGIPQRKEKRIIDADSQVRHLKKMTDRMPINQCNFQGGEVFTDPNFGTFMEKHAKNARVAIFTIAPIMGTACSLLGNETFPRWE